MPACSFAGIGAVLFDVDGSSLATAGWKNILTNMEQIYLFLKSQRPVALEHGIKEKDWRLYRCKQGICHCILPIVISGRHMATLYTGQFMYEGEGQGKFKFNDLDDSLSQVSHDEERLKDIRFFKNSEIADILDFFYNLGELISNLAEQNIRLKEKIYLREREIDKSKERFRLMAEHVPGAIYLCKNDSLYTMLYLNDSIEDITGYAKEDFLEERISLAELYHPEDSQHIRAAMEETTVSGNPFKLEYRLQHKSGKWRWIEAHGTIVQDDNGDQFFQGFMADITARKKSEQEKRDREATLRHQQKLESIGTLASGVAHEINNPLCIIMNYGELIMDDVDKDSVIGQNTSNIISESERIASIVRNLLTFSRQEVEPREPTDIEHVVDDTLTLMKRFIAKDNILLEIIIQSDLPLIDCHPRQIQQVLMNLLTNARDAVNELDEEGNSQNKKISVSCSQVWIDETAFVRTCVKDNGCGISENLLERIFDPFYSTKPRDCGTGLGLSVSHGIVKEHQGRLWLESELNKYTSFYLDIPAHFE